MELNHLTEKCFKYDKRKLKKAKYNFFGVIKDKTFISKKKGQNNVTSLFLFETLVILPYPKQLVQWIHFQYPMPK